MADTPRRASIAARLALTLALLFVCGGIAVAIAALAYGRSAADRSYDQLLVGAANDIAANISLRDGTVRVDLPVSAFDLLALAPEDRIVYAVLGPDGAVLTGYEGLEAMARDPGFHFGHITGEAARFAVVTRPFAERAFQGSVQVVVGQTTRARRALASEITQGALALVGIAGLVMSVLAVMAVRAALRPLARIETHLKARASQDLTALDLDVPVEIESLVVALNRFMARIDRQIAAMRTLIADASHQLRTPVAAMRAQAELAADEPDPARQQVIVQRIHQRSVNLSRLTDQLLSHAMIIHRADAVPLEQVDLRQVGLQAVEECDQDLQVSDADLLLDLPEDPVTVLGDRLSLIEACKNLIGNAVRHGRAPVTVRVAVEGARAVLVVHDCGPGLPEDDWPEAALRYSSRSGVSATSAGLGLAIVQAVSQAHQGDLIFRHGLPAGFDVVLSLGLAQEDMA